MKRKFITKKGIKFKPNHKEVEKAIKEYLAKGGTITQLEPENQYYDCDIIIEKSIINQTVTKNLKLV